MAAPEEDSRVKLVADALAAAADKVGNERARFAWKTDFHSSPVVELPVDQVLLNPRSHRIRSQLESHGQRDLIKAEPYAKPAQLIIEDLLRRTEGFAALRENLKEAKQREYGIATHAGLLVNANTRCVALRDNGMDYIRVAILPSDAQQKEIDALELRLQLQEDFRQEYSFSNQLLFVEELLKTYGFTDDRVAQDMNWGSASDPASLREGVKNVQRHVRMLAVIRELQHISQGRLPLTWLDDKRQALIDLDGEIEKLAKKDDASGKILKHGRLLGMLVGAFYRDLREVDQTFARKYLVPYLEKKSAFEGRLDSLLIAEAAPAPTLKGLDVFEAVSVKPPPQLVDLAPLMIKLAQSHGQQTIQWKDASGADVVEERAPIVAELLEAVTDATLDARTDRQSGNVQDRPRRFLEQAAKYVRRATEAYQEVRDHGDFKRDQFDVAHTELTAALASLTKVLEQPGQ